MTEPILHPDPWKGIPLDRYPQGEGWSMNRGGYSGSSNSLVASDVQRGERCGTGEYTLGSIQVDTRLDVNHPRTEQTLDEGMDCPSEESRPSRPVPSHQPGPGELPDV